MAAGRLIAIVGPSGAGKDSLLRYAETRFGDDGRFEFPRRVITRVADTVSEDHDSVDDDVFDEMASKGAFALTWTAHGLKYGIPKRIETSLSAGRTILVNLSRSIIGEASLRFPTIVVVEVTAAPGIIAARLAERGRETDSDVLERKRRSVAAYPAHLQVHRIRNDGSLADAGDAFCALLERETAVPA